jgi:hypothetical protein
MEFKEINVPEGIVQQIGHEGSFSDIAVDVGKGDNIYPMGVRLSNPCIHQPLSIFVGIISLTYKDIK